MAAFFICFIHSIHLWIRRCVQNSFFSLSFSCYFFAFPLSCLALRPLEILFASSTCNCFSCCVDVCNFGILLHSFVNCSEYLYFHGSHSVENGVYGIRVWIRLRNRCVSHFVNTCEFFVYLYTNIYVDLKMCACFLFISFTSYRNFFFVIRFFKLLQYNTTTMNS